MVGQASSIAIVAYRKAGKPEGDRRAAKTGWGDGSQRRVRIQTTAPSVRNASNYVSTQKAMKMCRILTYSHRSHSTSALFGSLSELLHDHFHSIAKLIIS
jgi:hypothetical protein